MDVPAFLFPLDPFAFIPSYHLPLPPESSFPCPVINLAGESIHCECGDKKRKDFIKPTLISRKKVKPLCFASLKLKL